MNGNELIARAFALSNALRVVSCAPQIWLVACDRGGAQAISCLTWNLWIAANASAAVVLITLAKRAAHARVAFAPTPAPRSSS